MGTARRRTGRSARATSRRTILRSRNACATSPAASKCQVFRRLRAAGAADARLRADRGPQDQAAFVRFGQVDRAQHRPGVPEHHPGHPTEESRLVRLVFEEHRFPPYRAGQHQACNVIHQGSRR